MNDSPCLIWFLNGTTRAVETLTPIAEDYLNDVKSGNKEELFFFYSDLNSEGNSDEADDDGVGKSLKTFAGILDDVEMLVLINIPDQQVSVQCAVCVRGMLFFLKASCCACSDQVGGWGS